MFTNSRIRNPTLSYTARWSRARCICTFQWSTARLLYLVWQVTHEYFANALFVCCYDRSLKRNGAPLTRAVGSQVSVRADP